MRTAAEAIERIRAHHDRTLGHSPTSRIAYCAEPDGISATYCEQGVLLAALEAAASVADETGLDRIKQVALTRPRGQRGYPEVAPVADEAGRDCPCWSYWQSDGRCVECGRAAAPVADEARTYIDEADRWVRQQPSDPGTVATAQVYATLAVAAALAARPEEPPA